MGAFFGIFSIYVTLSTMKVALVHELLTVRGGAEKVLRHIAALYPEAPIYTLLYDEAKLGDWFPKERVCPALTGPSKNHHLYLSRFPAAVEAWDFSGFDLVISSSSAFAHGIITNGNPKHLCYVHSPARYLWDRTHDVLDRAESGLLGPLKRAYLERVFHKLRIWDTETADRPDMLLAASKTVQRRIELYWRRESEVLHPPIDDEWLVHPSTTLRMTSQNSENYLVVSTLAAYKRIDLAIEACNTLKRPLVIAGEGPDKARLEKLAGPTVSFVGYKTGEELRALYASAKATIFPGDEDFGLVPLESLACGTPVIAYRSGGAEETLTDKTAVFFDQPTSDSLTKATTTFESRTWDRSILQTSIQQYSGDAFRKGLEKAVQELLACG